VPAVLQKLVRVAAEMARRLMGGFADYESYVRRERADHPNLPLMTYDEFIRHAFRRQT